MRTHDPRALLDLAGFGDPDGPDAFLAALRRRLRRRRLVRLAAAPVLLLAVVLAGPTALQLVRPPTRVEVVGVPAGGPATPCPEGDDAMRATRFGALLGAAALIGCTDAAGPPPAGETTAADATGPMVLELSGDLEGTFGLTVDPVDWVSRDSDEAALRAWQDGTLELPRMRFVSDEHAVTLSWPGWDEHRDPSRVALTFRVGDYLTSADPGQCDVDLTTGEPFVIRGTIDCTGLSGVKPGGDEPPIYDVHATVESQTLVCIDDETDEGVDVCRPVEQPTAGSQGTLVRP